MARIRSIKPEFWTSEQVTSCSTNARLAFIGMWVFADDNGIHPASPARLKMEVFPADDFTRAAVAAMVQELVDVGLVEAYEVDGETYWKITGWHHQRIDKPTYKHPLPVGDSPNVSSHALDESSSNCEPETDTDSTSPRRVLVDSSTSPRPRRGEERRGEERKEEHARQPAAARPAAPRPKRPQKSPMPADFAVTDRVAAWAASHGYTRLDDHLEAFRRKCAANGYAYADWDAAFMEAVREDWAKLRVVRDLRQVPGVAEPKSQLRELA